MTKKDYILIAKTLAESRPSKEYHPKEHSQWALTCLKLGEALKKANPNFDSEKFHLAIYK